MSKNHGAVDYTRLQNLDKSHSFLALYKSTSLEKAGASMRIDSGFVLRELEEKGRKNMSRPVKNTIF